jgi:hypothetical protein
MVERHQSPAFVLCSRRMVSAIGCTDWVVVDITGYLESWSKFLSQTARLISPKGPVS